VTTKRKTWFSQVQWKQGASVVPSWCEHLTGCLTPNALLLPSCIPRQSECFVTPFTAPG
jgi:hypothetical protein